MHWDCQCKPRAAKRVEPVGQSEPDFGISPGAAKISRHVSKPAKDPFMRVGVPKEVKPDEYRVAMMPVGVELLVKSGHQVFFETQAGAASGFPDGDYIKAGAQILPAASDVFSSADMIVKVKEP